VTLTIPQVVPGWCPVCRRYTYVADHYEFEHGQKKQDQTDE
jgi:hypothetical protein